MLLLFLLSLNLNRPPQDPVRPENRFVNTAKRSLMFYNFLQIYHSYYNEKLRVDKLASFAIGYKTFAVFVC